MGVANIMVPQILTCNLLATDRDMLDGCRNRSSRVLGGGQRDADWDGSGLGVSRLAILPGATHYNIMDEPSLPEMVTRFLA
jgi:hypothetical protein